MSKSTFRDFLKRKQINISVQTYLIDALGAMAFGVVLAQVLEVIRLAKLPPIPMKAVLTMNNLQWNTMQLYEELCREREAVQAQQNGQAPAEAGGEENAEAEAPKTEETKPEEPKTEETPEEKA